ncbi:hypothetical protein SAMN04488057_102224 [Cyclobacterium lianum]|uniref:Uncharacterized protein n=1 Tax=Cyclobacterium lianum TaxID=388280 RepID=A0A1M7K049_9BACT|nr:hypothetical protein SAMN04488057_102224 [Cyclobacterium lianum]
MSRYSANGFIFLSAPRQDLLKYEFTRKYLFRTIRRNGMMEGTAKTQISNRCGPAVAQYYPTIPVFLSNDV